MKIGNLFLGSLALTLATAVCAEESGDRWISRLESKLKLNAQQVQQLKKIHEETQPEREALRQQHRALHEKVVERVKAILNEEQRKHYETMRPRHEGWGWEGADEPPGMERCPLHGKGMPGPAGAGGDVSGGPTPLPPDQAPPPAPPPAMTH